MPGGQAVEIIIIPNLIQKSFAHNLNKLVAARSHHDNIRCSNVLNFLLAAVINIIVQEIKKTEFQIPEHLAMAGVVVDIYDRSPRQTYFGVLYGSKFN